jgi:hypothetical protein
MLGLIASRQTLPLLPPCEYIVATQGGWAKDFKCNALPTP